MSIDALVSQMNEHFGFDGWTDEVLALSHEGEEWVCTVRVVTRDESGFVEHVSEGKAEVADPANGPKIAQTAGLKRVITHILHHRKRLEDVQMKRTML